MRDWLAERGLTEVGWFAPRDVNDVERGMVAGEIQQVVFPSPGEFFELLWQGEMNLACWRRSSVRIEFANPGGAPDSAWAAAVLAQWERQVRRTFRQRAIAGVILSAVAIATAAIVLDLARVAVGQGVSLI